MTITGGSITNAPEYPNRIAAVLRTADVTFFNVTIYGTPALGKSSVKDCLLILDSTRIILDHVTFAFCEDELLDISGSTAVQVTDSIVAYPLNCAMHNKGCHPYNVLCIHCEVTFTRVLFAAGKERLPKCEHAPRCTVQDSLYFDIDGQGLNAAGETIVTFTGNIVLPGKDTDDEVYVIVSGNPEDYPIDPTITEKCTLVLNPHLATNGRWYPRVRRYGADRPLYSNPEVDSIVLSDTKGCDMPTEADFWARLNQIGSASQLSETIRQSVRDGSGQITSVPLLNKNAPMGVSD